MNIAGKTICGANKCLQLNGLWVALLLVLSAGGAQANPYWSPWYGKNTSIVVDAYAYSPIRWKEFTKNRKLIGFINKASDGLSPPWRCSGNETKRKLCKIAWRQHKAEEELFLTRRHLAKSMGLKWGSYHLGRPGNPIQQALHYLKYAKPQKDELIALDIEDIRPGKWMSLKDAEIFARFIKLKIGRYPLLYTNHATAKHIAQNKAKYPLLSRLNLWYARYRKKIPGTFPMGNWDSYTMWQFASQHNCRRRGCPWRMRGTDNRIDVNVVPMSKSAVRAAWPFDTLTARKPEKIIMGSKKVAAPKIRPEQVKPKEAIPQRLAYAPSPPHPDADRTADQRPQIGSVTAFAAALAPSKLSKTKPSKSRVVAALSEPEPRVETPVVPVAVKLDVSRKAAETDEEEIDPKYRITGRIPIPEPAPIFMEIDAIDAPRPTKRPYHESDGPQHKFMDDVVASVERQTPAF